MKSALATPLRELFYSLCLLLIVVKVAAGGESSEESQVRVQSRRRYLAEGVAKIVHTGMLCYNDDILSCVGGISQQ